MEFRVLGPVEVSSGGRPLQLGGAHQRALLAFLLLHANEVVSADRLLDELWTVPPGGGVAAVRTQVSRLRKQLGDRIVTSGRGYELRVEPGELDLQQFRALLAETGASDEPARRSQLLREADGLWRGDALTGLDAPFAEVEAAALAELRLAALEDRIEADLDRGRHRELVSELSTLVGRYPLRERLRGQLILALYRSGRQADALEAYRETRRTLDEQLGLEPSPALRELERAILTHDESLIATARVEQERSSEPPSPKPPRSSSHRTWAVIAGICASLGLAAAAVVLVLSTRSHASAQPPTEAAAVTPVVHHVTKRVPHKAVHRAVVAKRTVVKAKPTTVVVRQEVVTQTVSSTQAAPTQATVKRTAKPAHLAAQPTTTTTKDTSPVRTLSDDFSESSPNYNLWNVGTDGLGDTWALQNGELVFTIPASAQTGGQYNQVGPVWGSMCRFEGNFDARFDYQLLQWPRASGVILGLAAWIFRGSDFSGTTRSSGVSENYAGNVDGGYYSVNTTDTSGTLRIARVNGLETTYYRANGAWVKLNAALNPGETQLGLQLFSTARDWQHVDVSVALDNFTVTARDVICP
jgi:DNA-binding SARP family transcriptional activator